jgi:hypothetical protein
MGEAKGQYVFLEDPFWNPVVASNCVSLTKCPSSFFAVDNFSSLGVLCDGSEEHSQVQRVVDCSNLFDVDPLLFGIQSTSGEGQQDPRRYT